MKKRAKIKDKSLLFLVAAIVILCAAFLVISCGTDPQTKQSNAFAAATALDLSGCPSLSCSVAIESSSFLLEKYNITDKELTIEAWVKPKATSSGIIFSRMTGARGAKLTLVGTSTPAFSIRRTVVSAVTSTGTTTVEYTVNSGVELNTDEWAHVAGLLVNSDHSGVVGHPSCEDRNGNATGGEAETPHMDIYVDGTIRACATTSGGTTESSEADPTAAADAFADNPASLSASIGGSSLNGIVDEIRFWTTDRTSLLSTCSTQELGFNSGTCGRIKDNLIGYVRFNEGEGHTVNDLAGLGMGTIEYPDPNSAGAFLEYEDGWTTDIPDDATDITPAD